MHRTVDRVALDATCGPDCTGRNCTLCMSASLPICRATATTTAAWRLTRWLIGHCSEYGTRDHELVVSEGP